MNQFLEVFLSEVFAGTKFNIKHLKFLEIYIEHIHYTELIFTSSRALLLCMIYEKIIIFTVVLLILYTKKLVNLKSYITWMIMRNIYEMTIVLKDLIYWN